MDIAGGLSFLHSKRIVHLDLKSPNILLDAHNTAYVADVGLGRLLGNQGEATADAATFMWAAPEQLQKKPCNESADMWAFGVILWEICSGEKPVNRAMRQLR